MRGESGVDDQAMPGVDVVGGEQPGAAGGGEDDVGVAEPSQVVAYLEEHWVVAALVEERDDAGADEATAADHCDSGVG